MEGDLGWRAVDVVSWDVASTGESSNTQVDEIPQIVGLLGGLRGCAPHVLRGGSSPHRTSQQSTVNLRPRLQRLFSSERKTECL
jgi:hypothetical protein